MTISYRAGDWYLSFAYEQDRTAHQKALTVVGIDLGVKTLATLSNGEVFANIHVYRLAERKLKRLQRSLSRKQKGSANRSKARLKVARAHRRVADIRKDYLHKLTSYLAQNFETIAIEDLNVRGLMANRKLAKAIGDLGMHEFRRQLEYKCQLYGTKLIVVDRFFPSTKMCSCCGLVKDSMPLEERVFECTCGFRLDRDLNAAINLSNWERLAPGSLLRDSRSDAPLNEGVGSREEGVGNPLTQK